MVAIAHGKGVILAEPYEKMNGIFLLTLSKIDLTFALLKPVLNMVEKVYSSWTTTPLKAAERQ